MWRPKQPDSSSRSAFSGFRMLNPSGGQAECRFKVTLNDLNCLTFRSNQSQALRESTAPHSRVEHKFISNQWRQIIQLKENFQTCFVWCRHHEFCRLRRTTAKRRRRKRNDDGWWIIGGSFGRLQVRCEVTILYRVAEWNQLSEFRRGAQLFLQGEFCFLLFCLWRTRDNWTMLSTNLIVSTTIFMGLHAFVLNASS